MTRLKALPIPRNNQKAGATARMIFFCLHRPQQAAAPAKSRIWIAHSKAMDGVVLLGKGELPEAAEE